MRSFDILLVVDSEALAQALSETLRRAGHRVTSSTTIAGTVETLMRRGPQVDVIITNTELDSSLGYDAAQYGRKFAANAHFIALPEVVGGIDNIEQALAPLPVLDRSATVYDWN